MFTASMARAGIRVLLKEGGNVTLVCSGFSVPTPNISWINAWNVTMAIETMWQLQNITWNMAAQYTCAASNACGNDSIKVDVDEQCESLFIISYAF